MEEFYLNNNQCCAKLPTRSSDCLKQQNFLSEFGTKDEKEEARNNLGITELLKELKALIDNKIIEYGGVTWDLKPTLGNTDKVLSSDALYKTFSEYAKEATLNSKITQLWSMVLNKIDELEQRVASVTENGVALSDKFGQSQTIGISQKTLTKVVNDIYDKLSNCGCYNKQTLVMEVTPKTFVERANIQVTVYPSTGYIEEVYIYARQGTQEEVLIGHYDNLDNSVTLPLFEVTDTTVIRAVGTILGEQQEVSETIMKQKALYIGSGTSYAQVINPEYLTAFSDINLYPVSVTREGDYIFVILDYSEANKIGQITVNNETYPTILMSGIPIPMERENHLDIGESGLTVFKSKNTYHVGEYPLDIRMHGNN